MNKLKVLLSIIVMSLLMVGCGGSSSSAEGTSLDNSVLASESNAYGYIGANVIYGDIEVIGGWDLYSTDTFTDFYAYFNSDGTGYLSTTTTDVFDWRTDFVYGVSKDGRVINTSEEIKLTITSVSDVGVEFRDANGALIVSGDCYNVTYEDGIGIATFHMCPTAIKLLTF